MIIEIRQPLCFTQIGKKQNQEDSLYPLLGMATAQSRFFLVCDGVGGSEHGEVASQTVSQTLGGYLEEHLSQQQPLTDELFNAALDAAYTALDKAYDGAYKKMATTLTFLGLSKGGAFVAHIGDSRVYHVRPGQGIVSVTFDHSYVNELVASGKLTPEEAKTYPHKNIITRAMQPLMEKRAVADIRHVRNLCAGDYFFLCCDGVLERLTEEKLVEILSSDKSDDEKLTEIRSICDEGTRDNYSCYLVPIDNVTFESGDVPTDDSSSSDGISVVAVTEDAYAAPPATPAAIASPASTIPAGPVTGVHPQVMAGKKQSANKALIAAVVVLAIALVACAAFIFLGGDKEKNEYRGNTEQPMPTDGENNGGGDEAYPVRSDEEIDVEDDGTVTTSSRRTSGNSEAERSKTKPEKPVPAKEKIKQKKTKINGQTIDEATEGGTGKREVGGGLKEDVKSELKPGEKPRTDKKKTDKKEDDKGKAPGGVAV